MSNPIQQAIEGLERIVRWDELSSEFKMNYGSNGERDHFRGVASDALSALQSLQGVELPPLPVPTWSSKATGWPYHKDDMRAYARTAVAAAMARGAVPQGWRLDVDETAIYCNGRRVAALEYDGSNDSWRAACSLGQRMVDALNTAAPTPEPTQPTQAEAPSERERFDAYWLKRQRERGFGAKLTDAEMLAHSSDQDDEFHAWCAALATQQAGQGEAKISTEHGPWLPSTYGGEEGETYCQRCLLRSKFLGQRKCDPHIVYAPPAPQQQEQERKRWLCLTCKSDTPGRHGLMDDRVTPCPYAARSSEGGE